jgi:hypothetical protein
VGQVVLALLPTRLQGLVGSMMTLSLTVMLFLYLLVVKELMGTIPGSRVGSLLNFEAIF